MFTSIVYFMNDLLLKNIANSGYLIRVLIKQHIEYTATLIYGHQQPL